MIKPPRNPALASLSAMIVDSDPASIHRLLAEIQRNPRMSVGCTATSIATAIKRAATHHPDVVFLDVSMAGGEGMNVPRHLDSGQMVVVVTDRPEFAVAAFEFGAVDYLLKPVSAKRFQETLKRLHCLFATRSKAAMPVETAATTAKHAGRLSITDRLPLFSSQTKQKELVPVADVLWVEAVQNYSAVQLLGRGRKLVRKTLSEWELMLPQHDFRRVGRSHLVQIPSIRSTEPTSRRELLVYFHGDTQSLTLGRAATIRLKTVLKDAASG
ncbi:MAG: response regulator transcription factor [Planctomycetes bacterium]|nr:response regulator transcription factor [Planctomycetota bacterium]